MAGAGFKDFTIGEALTSSDVDTYLMQQTVMRFADAAARGSALGTAVGTAVPLSEGMVSYLDDTNYVQVYDGSEWVSDSGFNAGTAITASDSSWTVPALASPVVRLTVIGAGGGGALNQTNIQATGNAGGTTNVQYGATTVTATGGAGGQTGNNTAPAAKQGFVSANGGSERSYYSGVTNGNQPFAMATSGQGGAITVAYANLSGISTLNVAIGAGGTGSGGTGGAGSVLVEYKAG